MKKVLVVGGAGYVGGALTDILNHDADVIVYDNLLYEDIYQKPVGFVHGDIRDKEKLLPLLDWAECVVILGAIVGDGACALDVSDSFEVNTESVRWIADNFSGRIVFTSTCSVYGAQDGILTEESNLNPLSVYAQTKLAAEDALKDSNAIIFRLGTLFGLSDRFSRIRTDLVLNTMSSIAATTGELSVFGGEQYRPLLHVQDAARMIARAIDLNETGIFNLHRSNITMIDLANMIIDQASWPVSLKVVDISFEDSRNYRVNSSKAIGRLGFDPLSPIESGVDEMLRLFRSGRIKNPKNNRFSNHAFLEASRA